MGGSMLWAETEWCFLKLWASPWASCLTLLHFWCITLLTCPLHIFWLFFGLQSLCLFCLWMVWWHPHTFTIGLQKERNICGREGGIGHFWLKFGINIQKDSMISRELIYFHQNLFFDKIKMKTFTRFYWNLYSKTPQSFSLVVRVLFLFLHLSLSPSAMSSPHTPHSEGFDNSKVSEHSIAQDREGLKERHGPGGPDVWYKRHSKGGDDVDDKFDIRFAKKGGRSVFVGLTVLLFALQYFAVGEGHRYLVYVLAPLTLVPLALWRWVSPGIAVKILLGSYSFLRYIENDLGRRNWSRFVFVFCFLIELSLPLLSLFFPFKFSHRMDGKDEAEEEGECKPTRDVPGMSAHTQPLLHWRKPPRTSTCPTSSRSFSLKPFYYFSWTLLTSVTFSSLNQPHTFISQVFSRIIEVVFLCIGTNIVLARTSGAFLPSVLSAHSANEADKSFDEMVMDTATHMCPLSLIILSVFVPMLWISEDCQIYRVDDLQDPGRVAFDSM